MNEQFGPFRFLEQIGRGGMGEVFLAARRAERGFEKRLVVKRVLPSLAAEPGFLEMFLEEARLAARLNHPNIAQIFELGDVGGVWYIAMEHIEGRDLRRVQERAKDFGRPLSLALSLRIASEVAAGLEYAHRAIGPDGRAMGIVHRDVSPQNILIGVHGEVKLIDFGIARASTRAQKTATGSIRGKLSYLSPEQLGKGPIDARTDVFALGIVLWELLARRRLFDGESDAAILFKVNACAVPSLREVVPELPSEVEAVCARALRPEPDRRWPTAGAFRRALDEVALALGLNATAASLEDAMRELFVAAEPRAQAGPLGLTGTMTTVNAQGSATPDSQRLRSKSPVLLTRFVGRERELKELEARLCGSGRLVTLVGPPGIGKSRLALEHASRAQEGACAVLRLDLGTARETDCVVQCARRELRLSALSSADPERATRDIAVELERQGARLVVVDNVHAALPTASRAVGAWLEELPEARFIVTSRSPLGVSGELVVELGPLDEQAGATLFRDRARALGVELGPDDEKTAAELCRRLDGSPLAIELAAARARVLTPAQMLERLSKRFELLGVGPSGRAASFRQALEAAFAELEACEQSALAQLSVFVRGFSLEAAEEVLDLSDWPDGTSALDVLQALRDKSWVRGLRGEARPVVRFDLYESIAALAHEKLAASPERAREALHRHARYYLSFAERCRRALEGGEGADALEALAAERENLLTITQRSKSPASGPEARRAGVSAVLALAPAYERHGPKGSMLKLLELALHGAPAESSEVERAKALQARLERELGPALQG